VSMFGLLFVLPLFLLGSVVPAIGAVTNPIAWVLAIVSVSLYWIVGFSYLFDAIALAKSATRGAPKISGSVSTNEGV